MKREIPDFEAWAVFAAVAQHGSFTGAAVALGLSGATVSKTISRLEARIGATLLQRTTRSLSLTPIGQTLVGRAAALLSDAEEVEDVARDQAAGPRGLVRIAAPMSFGLAHIAPLLPDLADAFPGVSIMLDLSDAPSDLVTSGIDIAVRIGWLPDSRLKVRKLREIHTGIVASPGYLMTAGTPEHPEALSGHATLAYANLKSHDRWTLYRGTEEVTVTVHNRFVTNSGDAMLPLLRAGKAIALMPDFLVADDLRDGTLTRVLPDWCYRPAGLYIVAPTSGPRPTRVTAVLEFLSRRLEDTC